MMFRRWTITLKLAADKNKSPCLCTIIFNKGKVLPKKLATVSYY